MDSQQPPAPKITLKLVSEEILKQLVPVVTHPEFRMADGIDLLKAFLQKSIPAVIREALSNPDVVEDAVTMIHVGQQKNDDPVRTISIAVGTVVLLALEAHPAYKDPEQLSMWNGATLLTDEQKASMRALAARGFVHRPLARYAVMWREKKGTWPEALLHVAPDGRAHTWPALQRVSINCLKTAHCCLEIGHEGPCEDVFLASK